MTRFRPLCLAVVTLCVGLHAAPVAADDCDDRFGKIAREITDEAKEVLKKRGLFSPQGAFPGWDTIAASAAGTGLDLGQDMLGWWNTMAKGGWATLGPRHLGPEWEDGTLMSESSRVWIGPAPMMTRNTITIRKRDGKLKTRVRICIGDESGNLRNIAEHTFDGKDNDGTRWSKEITQPGSIVFVKLDGEEIIPDRFEYAIQMEAEPLAVDTGVVKGFADLHLHQMSEYGNGQWLHGSHTGSPSEVLKPCTNAMHILKSELSTLLDPEGKVRLGGGYPTFDDWPAYDDVGHQQVHESWLKKAHDGGLTLVVMCAVNNEPFAIIQGRTGDAVRDMPCLRRQISAAHAFDKASEWYEIVYTPWHARRAIHQGKLAVVLSVEASHLFPADEGHFSDQLAKLREMGVRSLQMTHETDSKFSGAAPHRVSFKVENFIKDLPPADEIKQLITEGKYNVGFDIAQKTGLNNLGLTTNGLALLDDLMDSSMLIDTAHMSWKAIEETYQVARKRDYYPLYNSHTRFSELLPSDVADRQGELCTPRSALDAYKRTGGVLGIRTGPEEMLPFKDKETGRIVIPPRTHGSAESFAQAVQYADANGVAIAYGTDMNGMAPQAAPRKESPGSTESDYRQKGLAHIGLLPSFHADLLSLKPEGADRISQSTEAFLNMWERAYERKGEAPNASSTVR